MPALLWPILFVFQHQENAGLETDGNQHADEYCQVLRCSEDRDVFLLFKPGDRNLSPFEQRKPSNLLIGGNPCRRSLVDRTGVGPLGDRNCYREHCRSFAHPYDIDILASVRVHFAEDQFMNARDDFGGVERVVRVLHIESKPQYYVPLVNAFGLHSDEV